MRWLVLKIFSRKLKVEKKSYPHTLPAPKSFGYVFFKHYDVNYLKISIKISKEFSSFALG